MKCKKCGRFSVEDQCPKCHEQINAAAATLIDALSIHQLAGRSSVFDVCQCGWKGFPYSDHTSLVLYAFMLRNNWHI